MIDYESKISGVVKQVPPSAIRRFFDLASEMQGVISLSIGEPDFVTPWKIREVGINSLIDGYTHYSPNAGYTDSRKAIVSYISRRYGVDYDYKGEVLIRCHFMYEICYIFPRLILHRVKGPEHEGAAI